MRLLKPTWVSHDGKPIFSVDIHPDGTRFATGGQGADAGRVVIWNMAPVVNLEDENNENVPKLLCQMDNHLACVNAVRWSHSGKNLATGGDDKVIMIWQQSGRAGGAMSSVFGSSVVNVENWKSISCLRSHTGDVLDLAWSPSDNWLATSSVDNTIIVWNTHKWQEIITVLRGHTSLVKGVVWDPIGKYLASQSDDKSLRVWRTYDWQPESVLTEPFAECGGTTHILRLAWSPDGQYLVSAHAMNNSGPTAQIVERDGWKTNKDFVGHRKAITCVRFNPNILSNTSSKDKVQHFCCCAIGSRDRSLSIWLTCLKRPLVVVHELFANSVLDISWNHLGTQLLVCSWDGSVAYLDFSEEELGRAISAEEKAFLQQKYYGKSVANNHAAPTNLIEDPELLKLQQQQQQKEEEVILQPPATENNKSSDSSRPPSQLKAGCVVQGPIDKQIETRMPDGRRRITPLFIPTDQGEVSTYSSVPVVPTFSSSTESKSKIVIEKRDESQSSMPSSSASTPTALVNGQVTTFTTPVKESAPKPAVVPKETPPPAPPTPDVPPLEVKRRLDQPRAEKRRPGRLVPPSPKTPAPPPVTSPHTPHSADSRHSNVLHLPAPRIEKTSCYQLSGNKGKTLEVENGVLLRPGLQAHRLRCVDSTADTPAPLWELVFPSRISLVASSRSLIAVCSEDGTMSLVSPQGRRLRPPLALQGQASRISCHSQQVLVATTRAFLSLWDFKTNTAIIKNESMLPILQSSSHCQVHSLKLTEKGVPIITLSTGKAYVYDHQLSAWLQVCSGDGPLLQSSEMQALLPPPASFDPLPLASIQSHLYRKMKGDKSVASRSQPCTVSFLESQLASAEALGSGKEFHFWLTSLVRYLVQEGLELRLRDICSDLLGPAVVQPASATQWIPQVLGLKKHDLLKEVLQIIVSNLKLQRLYLEYKEMLEQL